MDGGSERWGLFIMTIFTRNSISALAALVIFAGGPRCLANASALQAAVDGATAIVVGRIDNSLYDGTAHRIQVHIVYSVKGKLTPGTIISAYFSSPAGRRKGTEIPNAPAGNALMFMNQDKAGDWSLAALGYPALGLAGATFKITGDALEKAPTSPGSAPLGSVIQLMARTVEADSSQAVNFLRLVRFDDAPALFDAWSSSNSPVLRMYGLGARISAKQDADAVAAASTLPLSRKDSVFLWSTLLAYRNPDSKGVAAIGRIATAADADPLVVMNCAQALSAIHTRESIPYLYELLGSPDTKVRELAVAGFSAFVTNMRVAAPGADNSEALDEVLNPGRRRALPSIAAPFETEITRRFTHFGPFGNSAEEASYVSFWKSWYQQNRSLAR